MLEIACNVSHSFGGFPTDRGWTGPPATLSLTAWSSVNMGCIGDSRGDLGTSGSIPVCKSSVWCLKSCTHLSMLLLQQHVLCLLLLLQPTSPLILQPLRKVEYQRLHFLSWTTFASGSWSVLQRLWSLCYWRPFSQKYWSSTAKNLLDLKGYWQRQDNHENFQQWKMFPFRFTNLLWDAAAGTVSS